MVQREGGGRQGKTEERREASEPWDSLLPILSPWFSFWFPSRISSVVLLIFFSCCVYSFYKIFSLFSPAFSFSSEYLVDVFHHHDFSHFTSSVHSPSVLFVYPKTAVYACQLFTNLQNALEILRIVNSEVVLYCNPWKLRKQYPRNDYWSDGSSNNSDQHRKVIYPTKTTIATTISLRTLIDCVKLRKIYNCT